MNQIDFSVIIVSYENLQIVIDCLDSISRYNDIEDRLEIIIVDNSPENNIYNYIKANYPQVKIIKNNNKGFGEGNNVGVKNSNGKYLLFLNPDTIFIEPIFKFTMEKFEKEKDLALFGIKLVDINLNRNMSYYLIDKYGFIASQLTKLCNKIDIFIDGKMFIAGADIFVKRDVFISCGMFDENIFMYCEEADLIKRVKLLKMKTAYFKSKRIIHLEGKTLVNNEKAQIRRLASSQYYCNKYKLSFKKKLKNEIRYEYFKMLIYRYKNSKKSEICKNNISILKKFGKI